MKTKKYQIIVSGFLIAIENLTPKQAADLETATTHLIPVK